MLGPTVACLPPAAARAPPTADPHPAPQPRARATRPQSMSARRPAGAAAAAARRLLLSLALLGAAVAAAAAAPGPECEANPTLEACKDYVVPDAQLEAELYQLCAGSALGGQTYTGWPSGCSLWQECREGRADAAACQPMVLLQTACVSTMTTPDPVCLKCAPPLCGSRSGGWAALQLVPGG